MKSLAYVFTQQGFYNIFDYTELLADNTGAPEYRIAVAETRSEIAKALMRLSSKNRSVAELYFLHVVKTPEIE